jgi:hypothetical protein
LFGGPDLKKMDETAFGRSSVGFPVDRKLTPREEEIDIRDAIASAMQDHSSRDS